MDRKVGVGGDRRFDVAPEPDEEHRPAVDGEQVSRRTRGGHRGGLLNKNPLGDGPDGGAVDHDSHTAVRVAVLVSGIYVANHSISPASVPVTSRVMSPGTNEIGTSSEALIA